MAIIVLLHDDLSIKKISIESPELTIGRHPESDIYVDDAVVSKTHAVIETVEPADGKGEPEYYISDLDSTNHTYVNGDKIDRIMLAHNDLIRIGRHSLKFIDESIHQDDKTLKLRKSWIPGVYYTKE
ncbi:MAG: FHA domain-containing protein [Desulfobacteraceae bacterium]|nr:FHA domain-containing protein [Desulfobacteraceae bacterium]